jgi:cob(I)alamin adenosyltransferase
MTTPIQNDRSGHETSKAVAEDPQEDPAGDAETHARQQGKLKVVKDGRIARASREQGLLIVHTGSGKGKTTAALGMLVRALGHGQRCAVVQFIKGDHPTAEVILTQVAAISGGALAWDRCGQGFTWNTQDRDQDIAHAEAGWVRVRQHLADPELQFLLLDELNIVLRHGYLDMEKVLAEVQGRHPGLHVVITGRGAPESLLDSADLVTEMKEVKHPFKAGIKAQPGIEF